MVTVTLRQATALLMRSMYGTPKATHDLAAEAVLAFWALIAVVSRRFGHGGRISTIISATIWIATFIYTRPYESKRTDLDTGC
jgi:hypothetical protein